MWFGFTKLSQHISRKFEIHENILEFESCVSSIESHYEAHPLITLLDKFSEDGKLSILMSIKSKMGGSRDLDVFRSFGSGRKF